MSYFVEISLPADKLSKINYGTVLLWFTVTQNYGNTAVAYRVWISLAAVCASRFPSESYSSTSLDFCLDRMLSIVMRMVLSFLHNSDAIPRLPDSGGPNIMILGAAVKKCNASSITACNQRIKQRNYHVIKVLCKETIM